MHATRRPRVGLSAVFVGFLAAFLAAVPVHAGTIARILPDGVRVYDLEPAPDGYALAWQTTAGGERFVRLDPDGQPATEPESFAGPTPASVEIALAPVSGGWLVIGRNFIGPEAIWSIRLDAEGRTVAGPTTLVRTVGYFILGSVGLATNRGTHLLAWSEDVIAGDAVFALPLDDDGARAGDRVTLMPVPIQASLPAPMAAVAIPGGFLVEWSEIGQAVRARPTRRSGAPAGALEEVQRVEPSAVRPSRSFPASVGNGVVVVYEIGNAEFTEVRGRFRAGSGKYDAPVLLLGEALGDQGIVLQGADSRAGRFAVLYAATRSGSGGPGGWYLAEYDEALDRVAPPVSIEPDSGVRFVRAKVVWDRFHDRWIVHGSGDGPEGRGIYLVGVDPAD